MQAHFRNICLIAQNKIFVEKEQHSYSSLIGQLRSVQRSCRNLAFSLQATTSHQMDLFGVQELPNSKSVIAPGWAYVPDTGINPAATALQPSSNKRAARKQPTASGLENTAKQDAKILRDLAELDKDSQSHKDVQIPVPVRHRDNAGRGTCLVLSGQPRPSVSFYLHLHDSEPWSSYSCCSKNPPIWQDLRQPPLRCRSLSCTCRHSTSTFDGAPTCSKTH